MNTPDTKNLVTMLRMDDETLADYTRHICVAQLRAGYDEFTWVHGLASPTIPVPASDPGPDEPDADAAPPPPGIFGDCITGAALRAWRETRFLSQVRLGQQLGISGSTLSEYERGVKAIPLAIQDKLRVLSAREDSWQ